MLWCWLFKKAFQDLRVKSWALRNLYSYVMVKGCSHLWIIRVRKTNSKTMRRALFHCSTRRILCCVNWYICNLRQFISLSMVEIYHLDLCWQSRLNLLKIYTVDKILCDEAAQRETTRKAMDVCIIELSLRICDSACNIEFGICFLLVWYTIISTLHKVI